MIVPELRSRICLSPSLSQLPGTSWSTGETYGRTIRVSSVGDFKLISNEYHLLLGQSMLAFEKRIAHQSDGSVIVKGMKIFVPALQTRTSIVPSFSLT